MRPGSAWWIRWPGRTDSAGTGSRVKVAEDRNLQTPWGQRRPAKIRMLALSSVACVRLPNGVTAVAQKVNGYRHRAFLQQNASDKLSQTLHRRHMGTSVPMCKRRSLVLYRLRIPANQLPASVVMRGVDVLPPVPKSRRRLRKCSRSLLGSASMAGVMIRVRMVPKVRP
ncbi:MAG: hypothetical protein RL572_2133 [Pseudomonadota bacterium]